MRRAITAITFIAVAVFCWTLVRALWWAPDEGGMSIGTPASQVATVNIPPAEKPDRLEIPALQIDANIQYVGVNGKGNMGVPNNYTDVAWYKLGTIPGQTGSAVIAGHLDNGLGLPGVFKHLNDIKVGDPIFVKTMAGNRIKFVVDSVQSYPIDQVPLALVFSRSDGQWLTLITCTGAWVKKDRTYDERLVVFAKLALQ